MVRGRHPILRVCHAHRKVFWRTSLGDCVRLGITKPFLDGRKNGGERNEPHSRKDCHSIAYDGGWWMPRVRCARRRASKTLARILRTFYTHSFHALASV